MTRATAFVRIGQFGVIAACVACSRPAAANEATPVGLTASWLDSQVEAKRGAAPPMSVASDAVFLRRVSLDLIGRPPSLSEVENFAAEHAPDRRDRAIDRLIASPRFGEHWANYWSDVIRHRVPQPELTFLDYTLFRNWLAGRLNHNVGWDAIVRDILTARGKVKDQPAATFVGFQQADPVRLAGESTRIFLGVQLACAECHDHPFQSWKRTQFHSLAAFFVRTEAKLPWRDSDAVEVKAKEKGEYRTPDMIDPRKKGPEVVPVTLDARPAANNLDDAARRAELARWVTAADNPYFAKAYVNRIWARLMGRGFCEPVDVVAEARQPLWPEIHAALANGFVATGHDTKGLVRLVVSSQAYQRVMMDKNAPQDIPFASSPQALTGEQMFAALETAIGLPNQAGSQPKHNNAFRFPPPAKSTRDLVCDAFACDPSIDVKNVQRTMPQAMWLMNNAQLARQIDARPESGTMLARLLAQTQDDRAVIESLYQRVLARRPSQRELELLLDYRAASNVRNAAFEDLLWALLNSTEFTTKP
jgi:hypothetical protein